MSAQSSAAPPAGAPFSHREKVIIIAGLMLGMFLAALDQTIIAAALPRMAADLHDVEHMSWIVSAYLLTSTAVTPIYGKLSDLYGRKPMLQIAIMLFLLTSLLCALATTLGQLIAFRALQGLGGGGLLAMAHATIADVVSPRERGRYQGYIASVFAASSVIGPTLGGLFVEHLSWPWVFWINLPLGLAALVVSQTTLKRLRVKRLRHRIDYPGAVLIVAAVTCILLITTMGGNDVAWSSPFILWLGIAAAMLFLLALWQEARTPEPILPPRLFRNRTFSVSNGMGLLLSMVMIGALVFLPLFLQLVYRLSPGDSGLMLIPLTAAMVAGAVSAGQLVARTGRYKVFPLLGLGALAVAMLLLSFTALQTSLVQIGLYLVLGGFGIGMSMPVTLVAVQNAVEHRDLGVGTASISFFRSMGGSFGVALFGAVLIARLDHWVALLPGRPMMPALGTEAGTRLLHAGTGALDLVPAAAQPALAQAMLQSFHEVFRLGALIAVVALGICLLLREIPLRTSAGPIEPEAMAPAD